MKLLQPRTRRRSAPRELPVGGELGVARERLEEVGDAFDEEVRAQRFELGCALELGGDADGAEKSRLRGGDWRERRDCACQRGTRGLRRRRLRPGSNYHGAHWSIRRKKKAPAVSRGGLQRRVQLTERA